MDLKDFTIKDLEEYKYALIHGETNEKDKILTKFKRIEISIAIDNINRIILKKKNTITKCYSCSSENINVTKLFLFEFKTKVYCNDCKSTQIIYGNYE